MVKVGDRIRLSSTKGADREGVVTSMTGSMVRVRWPSGDETLVIPAPGTLTVLALSGDRAPAARRERAAPVRPAGKETKAKQTTPKGPAPKKTAMEKPATEKAASKTVAKRATPKKGAATTKKPAASVKRSSR
jgi:hypothetical protein